MEDWVYRALARWPNVPALYGWLSLDARGCWRIQGERISRPQIIDTINANYAADERGCWFFQNGPQRGYIALDSAPWVLDVDGAGVLRTHAGLPVQQTGPVLLDEEGGLWAGTEHGPAAFAAEALPWALERLTEAGQPVDAHSLARALALPNGCHTALCWQGPQAGTVVVQRIDRTAVPARLGFVPTPTPATF